MEDEIQPQPGTSPVPVTVQDVSYSESRLWLTFPRGYAEFVTRFGEGTVASKLRVFSPSKIEKELDPWRKRVTEHWLWGEKSRGVLPKERGVECVLLGDTLDADVVFHPGRPDRIFVLAKNGEKIDDAGHSVEDLLSFVLKDTAERDFAPGLLADIEASSSHAHAGKHSHDHAHNGEHSHDHSNDHGHSHDHSGTSQLALKDILTVASTWASKKSMQRMAESHIESIPNRKLLHESLVFAGDGENNPLGYSACWELSDASGTVVGRYKFSSDGEGFTAGFE
jgi:hypothetical protein